MTAINNARIGPWFRRHPHLAVPASSALFGAVFILQFMTGDMTDAITVLFVLPIALLALAFGLRAGTISSFVGVGLTVTWVAIDNVELSPLGWAARITPMLLLGFLIGHASDAQREAEALATDLAIAEERQREAAEINDTLVQNLAVAKWKLESGNDADGVELLEETIEAAENLVTSLLSELPLSPGERLRSRLSSSSSLSASSTTPRYRTRRSHDKTATSATDTSSSAEPDHRPRGATPIR